MLDASKTCPGQVFKITSIAASQLGLSEDSPAYGIVLDAENMMVFTQIEQRGYPGAKGGKSWASRVYPINWFTATGTKPVEADEVQDDVPPEFWPISARAGLNGGI